MDGEEKEWRTGEGRAAQVVRGDWRDEWQWKVIAWARENNSWGSRREEKWDDSVFIFRLYFSLPLAFSQPHSISVLHSAASSRPDWVAPLLITHPFKLKGQKCKLGPLNCNIKLFYITVAAVIVGVLMHTQSHLCVWCLCVLIILLYLLVPPPHTWVSREISWFSALEVNLKLCICMIGSCLPFRCHFHFLSYSRVSEFCAHVCLYCISSLDWCNNGNITLKMYLSQERMLNCSVCWTVGGITMLTRSNTLSIVYCMGPDVWNKQPLT